jgi:hypothetical protein
MNTGGRVSAVGGALALVAFAFLPYLSFGLISVTGWQIASAVTQLSAFSSGNRAFALIWLIPISSLVAAGLGVALAIQDAFASANSRRTLGILASLASLVGLVLLILALVRGQPSGTSTIGIANFLGLGYWLSVAGFGLGLVGGIMTVRAPDR